MSDKMLQKLTDRRAEIGPEIDKAKENWGEVDWRLQEEINKEFKDKGFSSLDIEFINECRGG